MSSCYTDIGTMTSPSFFGLPKSPRRRVQPDFASGMFHVAHVAVAQHRRKAMGGGQQVVVVHLGQEKW